MREYFGPGSLKLGHSNLKRKRGSHMNSIQRLAHLPEKSAEAGGRIGGMPARSRATMVIFHRLELLRSAPAGPGHLAPTLL